MVTFTCSLCGDSMKKAKVDQHFSYCKSSSVACIDCGLEFFGNDYTVHTSCISEAEKYQGSLFQGKRQGNTPVKTHENPFENIFNSSQNISPPLCPKLYRLLGRLRDSDNVPRKKAKLSNFIKNSLKEKDDTLFEKVWNLYEIHGLKKKEEEEQKKGPSTPSPPTISAAEKKVAKVMDTNDCVVAKKTETLKWKLILRKLIKKEKILFEELLDKFYRYATKQGGVEMSRAELKKKMAKKIQKSNFLLQEGDFVIKKESPNQK